MKRIRRIVAESLVGVSMLLMPVQASLEERVGTTQVEQVQAPKEEPREYEGGAGLMFNDIFGGGDFRMKSSHNWFLDAKQVGWSDYATFSYEYATVFRKRRLSEKERLQNQKRVFAVGYHLTYHGKPFAELKYYSDGTLDVSAFALIGGYQQQLAPGLRAEAGFGFRQGTNAQLKGEKTDVLSMAMRYKTPDKKDELQADALFSFVMPRRYINGELADGLWSMEGRVTFALNRKVWDIFLPAVSVFFTRDYALMASGGKAYYTGIQRYGISFGMNLRSGEKEKSK
ncbi:hypothetical protein HY491_02040 [Candidatus Woesearchaeota archaeon]|nr:hypothetical protein [Candidatus Woesearchaeota archaeon]